MKCEIIIKMPYKDNKHLAIQQSGLIYPYPVNKRRYLYSIQRHLNVIDVERTSKQRWMLTGYGGLVQ